MMDNHEQDAPPAGGFGSGPVSRRFGLDEPSAKPAPTRLGPIVTVAVMLTMLASVLVLVVVGCRRYIAAAKTAEARHSLAEISTQAAARYEERGRVCPSASQPVPVDAQAIRGQFYQASPAEWARDEGTDAGFACLKWQIPQPQYFQYSYFATPTSFLARARGDLNGDGVLSDFMWSGDVKGGHLVIAPRVYERDVNE